MNLRSFPALGFDPTPGDTASVQAVLMAMSRALRVIAATLPRLEEACTITDDAEWGGSAAEEFSDHGDDLPQGMGKGAEAMGKASEALARWGALMKANQDRAEELEDRARTLRARLERADDALNAAAGAIPRDPSSPHYAGRYNAYLGAVDAAAGVEARLHRVIDDAHRLQAKHLREADAAAEGVRGGPGDAFEPENDSWYVQTLDGVSKVSGIVSAATAAASAGLALTGVGAPAAAVLGTVSAGTAGVSALAGIGQRIAGSRNAPSNLSLALTVVPGRTVTSAAVGGLRGLARPVLGSSRLATGARGVAGGAADGLTTGGLPRLARDVAETSRYARQTGSLRGGLRLKAATDGAGQVLKGDARLAGEAFSGSVDATVRTIEAGGGHLSAADKRELEALKLLAGPRGDAAQNAVVNVVRDELNERHPK